MFYYINFVYKLKDKLLAADIFDGRLEKFGLTERRWSGPDSRNRRITDGQDELMVELEIDGNVQYVAYDWCCRSGQCYYPDVLKKLVNALNTEAEAVCCETENDDQLLVYCADHGIDSGLRYDPDDPLRHEKWIDWKRGGRYAEVYAAATAHAKKHTPPLNPGEDASVVHTAASDDLSNSE
jgi:hypothetical protein